MQDKHAVLTEAQTLYYQDLERLRGQRGKLLGLLIDGAWHRNYECAEVGGLSFNDSIFAFRQEGWIIESRLIKGGVWEFRLTGKGDPPEGHRPMTRPQLVIAGHYTHLISSTLGFRASQKIRQALPEWMRTNPRAWIAPENEQRTEEAESARFATRASTPNDLYPETDFN